MSRTSLAAGLLPQAFRNANFIRDSIGFFIGAVTVLAIGLASPSGLGSFGIGWLALLAFIAVFYFASWRLAVLEVSRDGINIRGTFRDRKLPWNEIDRFVIRDPSRRTPIMLWFQPWADQARVVLQNEEVHRIRALQPWHGLTALAYFSVSRPGPADDVVASLNELRRRHDRSCAL